MAPGAESNLLTLIDGERLTVFVGASLINMNEIQKSVVKYSLNRVLPSGFMSLLCFFSLSVVSFSCMTVCIRFAGQSKAKLVVAHICHNDRSGLSEQCEPNRKQL